MKKLVAFCVIASVIAAPAAAQETAAPAVADNAPIPTKSGTIGAPPTGKSQVVFWRPGTIIGGALGCTAREGAGAQELDVARLGAGKYWVHVTEPGRHDYFAKGEATDRLTIEVEPDETVFVRCSIGMGVMSGRANLSPSTREEFTPRAKKMKSWEPDPNWDPKVSRDEG